jgi:hypothetical protein
LHFGAKSAILDDRVRLYRILGPPMDFELICSWLQLPAGSWPPDHYTLLGLAFGEADVAHIEQQVHERMAKVRCYQLPHPDAATEAMNRLAQALLCLTDPGAKKTYDANLRGLQLPARNGRPGESSTPGSEPRVANWETTPPPRSAQWEDAPPPLRVDWDNPPPVRLTDGARDVFSDTAQPAQEPVIGAPVTSEFAEAAATSAEPTASDPVVEAARVDSAARKGLTTRRALQARAIRTRQLLWAWQSAGKYLSQARRLLSRPREATELIDSMHSIRDLLQGFPPILGQAGQPGYLVLTLARQEIIVPVLQTLLPSQREALARDWQAGYDRLTEHRRFLLHELRGVRRRGLWGRAVRVARLGLRDYAGVILFLMGLVALNLAYPLLQAAWLHQILAVAAVIAIRWFAWWWSARPVRLPPPGARKRPVRARIGSQPNSSGA